MIESVFILVMLALIFYIIINFIKIGAKRMDTHDWFLLYGTVFVLIFAIANLYAQLVHKAL
jgi:hypothetical protein